MANFFDQFDGLTAKKDANFFDQFDAKTAVPTGQDVAASALSGLGRGIPETLEFLGAATATLPSAAISAARGNYQGLGQEFRGLMEQAPITSVLNRAVGQPYQPQTEAGRYARAMGAGAATGVIGGIPGILSGLAGGAGAEGGGDIAAATMGEDYRTAGNVAGGVLGGLSTYRYGAAPTARGIAKAAEEAAPLQGKPLAVMKQDAYAALDASKSAISRSATKDFIKKAKASLERQGYEESDPDYAPIKRRLELLALKPQSKLTPSGFDSWLKGLSDVTAGNKDSARIAGILKRQTGQFLENIQPNQMAYGMADDAKLVRNARKLNARYERDLAIEDAFTRVGTRGATVSEEVAIKNEFRRLSRDDNFMSGLPEDVKGAVETAATTGNTERLLRKVGGLSPAGGRLGMAMNAGLGGAAIGTANPAFIIPGVLGFAADAGAGMIASRQANLAADAVRRLSTQRPGILQRASGLARNVAGEIGGQVRSDVGVLTGLLKPNPKTNVRMP